MQRKEAALVMGMDASLMKRRLSGDGNLTIQQLSALPATFWVALLGEIRIHFKFDDPAEITAQGVDLISRGVATILSQVKR
jgi:hypothetical protein